MEAIKERLSSKIERQKIKIKNFKTSIKNKHLALEEKLKERIGDIYPISKPQVTSPKNIKPQQKRYSNYNLPCQGLKNFLEEKINKDNLQEKTEEKTEEKIKIPDRIDFGNNFKESLKLRYQNLKTPRAEIKRLGTLSIKGLPEPDSNPIVQENKIAENPANVHSQVKEVDTRFGIFYESEKVKKNYKKREKLRAVPSGNDNIVEDVFSFSISPEKESQQKNIAPDDILENLSEREQKEEDDSNISPTMEKEQQNDVNLEIKVLPSETGSRNIEGGITEKSIDLLPFIQNQNIGEQPNQSTPESEHIKSLFSQIVPEETKNPDNIERENLIKKLTNDLKTDGSDNSKIITRLLEENKKLRDLLAQNALGQEEPMSGFIGEGAVENTFASLFENEGELISQGKTQSKTRRATLIVNKIITNPMGFSCKIGISSQKTIHKFISKIYQELIMLYKDSLQSLDTPFHLKNRIVSL